MGWMILAGSASFLGRNICDRSLATSVTASAMKAVASEFCARIVSISRLT